MDNTKRKEQETTHIMRVLRGGTAPMVMEVLDRPEISSLLDAQGNTALHAVLMNPALNGSAKLMDAMVQELVDLGVNPHVTNVFGQSPRALAQSIIQADNISDRQFGGISAAIVRLMKIEQEQKKNHPVPIAEKAKTRGADVPQGWAASVQQQRGALQLSEHTR